MRHYYTEVESRMSIWVVAIVALSATSIAAPLVRAHLVSRRLLDLPNHRSSHTTPTPRGGGFACLVGLTVAALVAATLGLDVPWSVVGAAIALSIVGLADDRLQLPAVHRLLIQTAVGGLLGALIDPSLFGVALGVVIVPLLVNTVNFMDGINGITALTLGVWGVITAIGGHVYGVPALTFLGATTAGSSLGFLPWNAPRAKMFLGDIGSYLLGALAAGGILTAAHVRSPAILVMAPLGIYVLDVGITLVRRAFLRQPLTQAHREHIYQRLVTELHVPHIVAACWVAMLSLAMALAFWTGLSPVNLTIGTAIGATYLCSLRIWRVLVRHVRLSARGRS